MRISILGCSGGRGKNLRPTAFLIDGKILLDAGAVTEALTIERCADIDHILVTHSHIDHISDLPFLAQLAFNVRKKPIILYSIKETKEKISEHMFNGHIYPDLSVIPNKKIAKLTYKILKPLEQTVVSSYNILPIPVNHTVPAVGYLIDDGETAFAFTGDTYLTNLFWETIQGHQRLSTIIIEASFPNRLEEVARITGHLTPNLLVKEIEKLNRGDVKIFATHIMPLYRKEVIEELRDLSKKLPLKVLKDDMDIRL